MNDNHSGADVCHRCARRRCERREVLAELLETEVRYGRDLRVLQDELYKPLLVAGLVPLRQLGTITTPKSNKTWQRKRHKDLTRIDVGFCSCIVSKESIVLHSLHELFDWTTTRKWSATWSRPELASSFLPVTFLLLSFLSVFGTPYLSSRWLFIMRTRLAGCHQTLLLLNITPHYYPIQRDTQRKSKSHKKSISCHSQSVGL